MEFALPELLSREEILNILYQRQLHIQNLDELNHEELMRVYKTFILPLSRRPVRPKRISADKVSTNQSNNYEEQMQVSLVEPLCTLMDIDLPSMAISTNSLLNAQWKMTSPLVEKRRQTSSDDEFFMIENDDQYLSSATKRIKIYS